MSYVMAIVALSLTNCGSLLLLWWYRRSLLKKYANLQTQYQQELQRFLQRLDHELKNPLTAIRFALVNLAVPETEVQEKARTTIDTQTHRMSELITELRKLAELEYVSIEHIPVSIDALINEAVMLTEADPQRIRLEIEPECEVKGDKYLLLLAIYNLLDNALKFTQAGSEVNVQAYDSGAGTTIIVADNGPGIDAADLEHVWKELYRGRGVQHIEGSGLGLSMVKAIIERHGGKVGLESTLGHGVTVTLDLPYGT